MSHPIRDRIQHELRQLGNQKRHYLVAIAVAEKSGTLRRHIRTVQRLDEEMCARREVLAGLPGGTNAVAFVQSSLQSSA